MSNVTLDIAGRKFTVACAEGEEAHIGMLGRTINAKLLDMPNIASQTEARALLFAALLLADENHELKRGAGRAADKAERSVRRAEAHEHFRNVDALAADLERFAAGALRVARAPRVELERPLGEQVARQREDVRRGAHGCFFSGR